MNISPIQLQWSEVKEPCKEHGYHHCIAETPFGRFLISWKGHKDDASFCIEESPWGWLAVGSDLDDAKEICQIKWNEVVLSCMSVSE